MPDQCNVCERDRCGTVESVLHILRGNEHRKFDWEAFPRPCSKFVPPAKSWKLTELISAISISDASSDIVKWILKYARRERRLRGTS